jgi:hypothetical protein
VAGNKKELFTPTRFMLPTSHYDEKRAQFVIDFIQNLRHTKGEWFNKPFFYLIGNYKLLRIYLE